METDPEHSLNTFYVDCLAVARSRSRVFFVLVCLFSLIPFPLMAQQADNSGPREGVGRGMGGGMFDPSRGVSGTILAVGKNSLTVKTDSGQEYKVFYSANTHFMKEREPGSVQDLLVGDAVVAMGELNKDTLSIGAVFISKLSPERAKQMHEMEASYGKTWLAGKVISIDGTVLKLQSPRDSMVKSVDVDENTSFKKHRESITLADVKAGDMVMVRGVVKGDSFWATELNVAPPRGDGQPPAKPEDH